MDSGLILFRFPCPAEFPVPEQGGNPAELLEAQQFFRVHPQIFEYPRIRHARLRQLLDNIGHEGDIMRSPGTVVPDGGSHASQTGGSFCFFRRSDGIKKKFFHQNVTFAEFCNFLFRKNIVNIITKERNIRKTVIPRRKGVFVLWQIVSC